MILTFLFFINSLFACETIDCDGNKFIYDCSNVSTLFQTPSLCNSEDYCRSFSQCDGFNPKNSSIIPQLQGSDLKELNKKTIRGIAVAQISNLYQNALSFNNSYNNLSENACSLDKIYQNANCRQNLNELGLDQNSLNQEFKLMDQGYYEPPKNTCFEFKAQMQMEIELNEVISFGKIKQALNDKQISQASLQKFKNKEIGFLELLKMNPMLSRTKKFFEDPDSRLNRLASTLDASEFELIMASLDSKFEYPLSVKSKLYSGFQSQCQSKMEALEKTVCGNDFSQEFVLADVRIFNKSISTSEKNLGYHYQYCEIQKKTNVKKYELSPVLTQNLSSFDLEQVKNNYKKKFDDNVNSLCPVLADCTSDECIKTRCAEAQYKQNVLCENINSKSGSYTLRYLGSVVKDLKTEKKDNHFIADKLKGANTQPTTNTTPSNNSLASKTNQSANQDNTTTSPSFQYNPNQQASSGIKGKIEHSVSTPKSNDDLQEDHKLEKQKEDLLNAANQFEKDFQERVKRQRLVSSNQNSTTSQTSNPLIQKGIEPEAESLKPIPSNSTSISNVANYRIDQVKNDELKKDTALVEKNGPTQNQTNADSKFATHNLNTKDLKETYKNNITVLEDIKAENLKVEIKVSHFNLKDIDTLVMAIEEQLGKELKKGRTVDVTFIDESNRKIHLKMEPMLNSGILEYKVSPAEGNRVRDEEVAKNFAAKLNKKMKFDLSQSNKKNQTQYQSKLSN